MVDLKITGTSLWVGIKYLLLVGWGSTYSLAQSGTPLSKIIVLPVGFWDLWGILAKELERTLVAGKDPRPPSDIAPADMDDDELQIIFVRQAGIIGIHEP